MAADLRPTEPRTAAGRRLLALLRANEFVGPADILAIEAEAAALEDWPPANSREMAAIRANATALDVERLARALVRATREQAGEPDGKGWPGYVDELRGQAAVTLNVNELSEAIAAEYARLGD